MVDRRRSRRASELRLIVAVFFVEFRPYLSSSRGRSSSAPRRRRNQSVRCIARRRARTHRRGAIARSQRSRARTARSFGNVPLVLPASWSPEIKHRVPLVHHQRREHQVRILVSPGNPDAAGLHLNRAVPSAARRSSLWGALFAGGDEQPQKPQPATHRQVRGLQPLGKRGRRIGIPAAKLAYVELDTATETLCAPASA